MENRRSVGGSLYLAFLAASALLSALPARADLASYLARPEPAYAWEQVSFKSDEKGSVQELSMVSQTWQGSPWKHRLEVFRTAKPAHPEFCLLYNTGGNGSRSETATGRAVADATGCTVAILHDVPNQPLYGKTEDALIVYTFQKYVETGDETWPLLFPMVKSVIKAMDAVQASALSAKQPAVTKFLVTGASKRGWTAWLSGASGDRRIVAIAPIVFDMLDMPAQIPHQLAMYGKPSEMIRDYSEGGLLTMMDSAAGKRLISMVDPYSVRSRLTMPKLIVLGSNDRYWAPDALNLYWNDLPGLKWVLYIPNKGHDVDDPQRLLATIGSFTRAMADRAPWPNPKWKLETGKDGATLTITSDQPITSARLFRAHSDTKDFRNSWWNATAIPVTKNTATARAPLPESGSAASFAEITYTQDGKPFTLSTQMLIQEAKK